MLTLLASPEGSRLQDLLVEQSGEASTGGRCCEQTLTETGSLLSLKAWKLKLRGCCVAFLTGTRFPEHSRCSGIPSISCTHNHRRA